jgi:predicted ATPase
MLAQPILLRGLKLSGYRGVSGEPGEELELNNLANRNIFVGPNNGGKSTVFSFVQWFIQLWGNQPAHLPKHAGGGAVDPGLLWQHDLDHGRIEAILTFTSPGPDFARIEQSVNNASIVRDGMWSLALTLTKNSAGQWAGMISPRVWLGAKMDWFIIAKVAAGKANATEIINEEGVHVLGDISNLRKNPFIEHAASLAEPINEWVKAARFFDPFRALRRTGVNAPQVEDGSQVLQRLNEWQNDQKRARTFQDFRRRLLSRLNKLFQLPFESLEMKGAPQIDMMLTLKADGATPIPLNSMGSGIAEMVIILAALESDAANKTPGTHYYLEEPELHLHARLLRRFMAQLGEFAGSQFFITTHSNVVLDSLSTERDRVYLFSQRPKGNCVVSPAQGLVEQHAVLDALGVNGSTLLQANCVIWVEGPSDRLYIRKWLEDIAAEKKEPILEGADYAFAFYGGKVLSHFGFNEDDSTLADLIPMLSVSRFSAIIMDRDRDPSEPNTALSATKKRIIEAAAADKVHRLACVTVGREIENDLASAIFAEAAARHLGRDVTALQSLVLTGTERYPAEVANILGLTGEQAKACKDKLGGKVPLARVVLDVCQQPGKQLIPRPPYASELFDFILKSRVE